MKVLVTCLLLLIGIGCKSSNASRGSNTQAIVTKTAGSTEFLQNGGWQPLRTGQVFVEGDQVRTGADGQVDVNLTPYGGVMTVMPNSTIQMEQLGTRGTNQQAVAVLRLTRGRVVG